MNALGNKRVWAVLCACAAILYVISGWLLAQSARAGGAKPDTSCRAALATMRQAKADLDVINTEGQRLLEQAAANHGYAALSTAGPLITAVQDATATDLGAEPACDARYGARKVNDRTAAIHKRIMETRGTNDALRLDLSAFELNGPRSEHIRAFLAATAARGDAESLVKTSDGKVPSNAERDALKTKLAALGALVDAPLDVTDQQALVAAAGKLGPATDEVKAAVDALQRAIKAKQEADAAAAKAKTEAENRAKLEAIKVAQLEAVAQPQPPTHAEQVPVEPYAAQQQYAQQQPVDPYYTDPGTTYANPFGNAQQQPVGGDNGYYYGGGSYGGGDNAQARPLPGNPCHVDPTTGRLDC